MGLPMFRPFLYCINRNLGYVGSSLIYVIEEKLDTLLSARERETYMWVLC
jgi:hypothetical protein